MPTHDSGHAREAVEGMWLMIPRDTPMTMFSSTGETRSIRNFIEVTIEMLGRRIERSGQGVNEVGLDPDTSDVIIKFGAYST